MRKPRRYTSKMVSFLHLVHSNFKIYILSIEFWLITIVCNLPYIRQLKICTSIFFLKKIIHKLSIYLQTRYIFDGMTSLKFHLNFI